MAVKEEKMEGSKVESRDSEEPRIGVFCCHCGHNIAQEHYQTWLKQSITCLCVPNPGFKCLRIQLKN